MKAFLKATIAVSLLVTFGVIVTALIPPALYLPEPRHIPDESEFKLGEKVGWYRENDASNWLITWGWRTDLL